MNVLNNHIRNSYILSFYSDIDGAGTAYDQGAACSSSGDDGLGEDELLGCGCRKNNGEKTCCRRARAG